MQPGVLNKLGLVFVFYVCAFPALEPVFSSSNCLFEFENEEEINDFDLSCDGTREVWEIIDIPSDLNAPPGYGKKALTTLNIQQKGCMVSKKTIRLPANSEISVQFYYEKQLVGAVDFTISLINSNEEKWDIGKEYESQFDGTWVTKARLFSVPEDDYQVKIQLYHNAATVLIDSIAITEIIGDPEECYAIPRTTTTTEETTDTSTTEAATTTEETTTTDTSTTETTTITEETTDTSTTETTTTTEETTDTSTTEAATTTEETTTTDTSTTETTTITEETTDTSTTEATTTTDTTSDTTTAIESTTSGTTATVTTGETTTGNPGTSTSTDSSSSSSRPDPGGDGGATGQYYLYIMIIVVLSAVVAVLSFIFCAYVYRHRLRFEREDEEQIMEVGSHQPTQDDEEEFRRASREWTEQTEGKVKTR